MSIRESVPVWSEPIRGGFPDAALLSLSGLDLIRAYVRGEVAPLPMTRLLGLQLTHHGSGSATFAMRTMPWLQLPDGSLDVCIPCGMALRTATLTTAPPAFEVSMAAFSINRLRPFTLESTSAVSRARVMTTGRAYTFAEVSVEDGLGRLLAHATGSFILRPLVPPPPPAPDRFPPVPDPQFATPDPTLRPLPTDLFPFQVYGDEDGLTILKRLIARTSGAIPGYELVGVRVVDARPGLCVMEMPATAWVCSIHRVVEPAVIAFFANQALTGAVETRRPAGKRVGVLAQGMSFVRAAAPDGRELNVRAKVMNDDVGVVVTTADVTDADGNQIAFGYQTSVLLDRASRPSAGAEPDRVLATVLFVDIVGSTELAQRLGDAAWREQLDAFDELVRNELTNYRGRQVKNTGDGFLATFDAAARAVRCACAIRDGAERLGLHVRAGLHVGECQLLGADIGGIAVHVARRVESAAAPDEILVSGTVRDSVAGSGLTFSDRGRHRLRGVDGDWQLFALES